MTFAAGEELEEADLFESDVIDPSTEARLHSIGDSGEDSEEADEAEGEACDELAFDDMPPSMINTPPNPDVRGASWAPGRPMSIAGRGVQRVRFLASSLACSQCISCLTTYHSCRRAEDGTIPTSLGQGALAGPWTGGGMSFNTSHQMLQSASLVRTACEIFPVLAAISTPLPKDPDRDSF